MASKTVKIAKTKTSRPKKNGKAPETVKSHHLAKATGKKAKGAVNTSSNYGVK
jgi:hypothetical protein